jgi:PhzF family phenazine biosynthesis protein
VGSLRFVLTDVFTGQPFTGNPLAVFPDAEGLDAEQMQAIAREFGHSETTFVLPPHHPVATFRLRCFTPAAEVFGAGHNALGAWWVLAQEKRIARVESTTVRQELGEQVLPVEVHASGGVLQRISMTQGRPVFGGLARDREALAAAVGLDPSELDVKGLHAQAVSTGANHLLVPVRSLAALGRVRVDPERLVSLARPLACSGCYLYCLETREPGALAHARAFFPGIGIGEDPATGSAAGPLAAYLAARGKLGEGVTAVVEQGDEMGRPSRIEVQVTGERVEVGGRSVIVAEGTLRAAPQR